jgi:glutathione S-transferase
MSEIIFHHYPQSPVAEKVRCALGIKKLAWRSVEHNRLPDRPELFAMTAGYRRIPVMQIGADIYCDSQCILRELERRHPEPTFFPGPGKGMPWAVSRWTDGPIFELMFRIAFAPVMDSLPPALVTDRSRLYLGPGADLKKELADLPHTLAQLRGHLGWLEAQLESGKPYLTADKPGLADAVAWHIMWFFRARYGEAARFMEEFPRISAWEERIKALGQGTPTPMTAAEALAVAKGAETIVTPTTDPRDPQGLKPGLKVSIGPLTDTGEKQVEGTVRAVGRETLVIDHAHELCGKVAIHFPRVGYKVTIR